MAEHSPNELMSSHSQASIILCATYKATLG